MQSYARLLSAGMFLLLLPSAPAAGKTYPTDRCVSAKRMALGKQCRAVLGAHADHMRHRDLARLELDLAEAELALDAAYLKADQRAVRSGVDCADSGAGSVGTSNALEAAAAAVAAAAGAGLDLTDTAQAKCGQRLLDDAKAVCRRLFRAEGRHLLRRGKDRLREKLAAQRAKAGARYASRQQKTAAGACAGLPAPDLAPQLEDTVAAALASATTTSSIPVGQWSRVDPARVVRYRGRNFEPRCSTDTDYFFFARRGTVNKLVMYYMGGGACWNDLTCRIFPVYNVDLEGFDASDLESQNGFADFDNPANPFREWNAVFVPYCSGDIHWGDVDFNHGTPENPTIIMHRGVPNARVAEKWAREHFVMPDEVFVTGSSAGAYGAIMHSLSLQEDVYPSSRFVVLGDAGNGVVTDDFVANEIGKWNVEANLPRWIPAFDVSIGELNAADLWVESALFYPENRFATYTTAYDGGAGGQTGFFNIMLNGGDAFAALTWWNGSCAWNEGMRALNLDAAARAPNFRYYIGTGSRHTVWGRDKVYDDTTGNVPTVVDWLNAMLAGSPAWVNVECEDCGTTLAGDPVPDVLPTVPFDASGNIVCPAP